MRLKLNNELLWYFQDPMSRKLAMAHTFTTVIPSELSSGKIVHVNVVFSSTAVVWLSGPPVPVCGCLATRPNKTALVSNVTEANPGIKTPHERVGYPLVLRSVVYGYEMPTPSNTSSFCFLPSNAGTSISCGNKVISKCVRSTD